VAVVLAVIALLLVEEEPVAAAAADIMAGVVVPDGLQPQLQFHLVVRR
jgi:hypothetical protein